MRWIIYALWIDTGRRSWDLMTTEERIKELIEELKVLIVLGKVSLDDLEKVLKEIDWKELRR